MARSQPITVVARKIQTVISISVVPTDGDAPFDITVSGVLSDSRARAVPNRQVDLYINTILVGFTTTNNNGNYALVYTIQDPGTYIVETEFPGDNRYAGCLESMLIGKAETPPSILPILGILAVSIGALWYFSREK